MGNINACVDLQRAGAIALVTFDNPPINALKHAVREGLCAALDRAASDPGVTAIVFLGAGCGFSAGADITEFGKPPLTPTLHDLIAKVEASAKPVIAALHGLLQGGGFELALACHHRVAAPGTRAGLPEALIAGSADPAAVGGADIVIEAVFEDMALKQWVFADSTGWRGPAQTKHLDLLVEALPTK